MPAIVTCPKCKTKYKLPDTMLGKPIKCKSCGTAFRTKAGANPAGAAASPARAPADPGSSSPQPAAGDLAKYGLDGPLRKQADLFAGATPLTRQSRDILGNLAADPGFADLRADPIEADVSDRPANDLSEITQNPYLPPSAKGSNSGKPDRGGGSRAQGDPNYQYKSLGLLAWLLSAGVGVNCLLVFGFCATITFLFFSGTPAEVANEADVDAASAVFIAAGLGLLAMYLAIGAIYFFNQIMICIFMYRANANVRALGATGLEISPGWSAGYWFIPFVNWVKPVQSMSEIYRASIRPKGKSWQKLGAGAVNAWWILWIIPNIVAIFNSLIDPETIGITGVTVVMWLIGFCLILAGIMLIKVVFSISKNQAARAS